MSASASHIAIDTALCRAGLLNVIQPIGPSLSAIILSVLEIGISGFLSSAPGDEAVSWSLRTLADRPETICASTTPGCHGDAPASLLSRQCQHDAAHAARRTRRCV